MESFMSYRRDNSHAGPNAEKRTFNLINIAISLSTAILLSALLLSFMLA